MTFNEWADGLETAFGPLTDREKALVQMGWANALDQSGEVDAAFRRMLSSGRVTIGTNVVKP